jgi:predicted CXXCH cytochrome family protein
MRNYNPSIRVDQVTEYYTSVHGTLLREENDSDVATCVSCHPAHRILPPSDLASSVHPLNVGDLCSSCHDDESIMASRGGSTDHLEQFRGSVHGVMLYEEGDVSAPTCNDCHGNHGAAPPGIGSIQNVCSQCHTVMGQYFDESKHVEIFQEAGLPGCETCHGNHAILAPTDAFLTDRTGAVCRQCHAETDPTGDAFLVMAGLIDSLRHARATARETLEEAENVGIEVSQALFELEEVDNAFTKARSAIHAFSVVPVQEEVEAGLEITRNASAAGEEALEEFDFRRVGLAVSAAIILLLIVALVLRMRSIEAQVDRLFASIDSFFEEAVIAGVTGATGGDREEAIRLAACGLLLEIAFADADFSEEEREHLEGAIQSQFELDKAEARRLVALAEAERQAGAGLHRFTVLINRHFDAEAKRALMETMWGLVYADGVLTEHEQRIMSRIADLLGERTARPGMESN